MVGYPDYNEIQSERARRLRQEQEGGRQQTFRAMAEGLVDRVRIDYKLPKEMKLDTSSGDPREWTVKFEHPIIGVIEELFFDFPSPELRTKLMLIGAI